MRLDTRLTPLIDLGNRRARLDSHEAGPSSHENESRVAEFQAPIHKFCGHYRTAADTGGAGVQAGRGARSTLSPATAWSGMEARDPCRSVARSRNRAVLVVFLGCGAGAGRGAGARLSARRSWPGPRGGCHGCGRRPTSIIVRSVRGHGRVQVGGDGVDYLSPAGRG
jgi:hypothetical protein